VKPGYWLRRISEVDLIGFITFCLVLAVIAAIIVIRVTDRFP
jgi:hypothetical protein